MNRLVLPPALYDKVVGWNGKVETERLYIKQRYIEQYIPESVRLSAMIKAMKILNKEK
tara:strand:- start:1882 stop:2055 length:174 start_codon:yes stop_codon:yes gene_type:complete